MHPLTSDVIAVIELGICSPINDIGAPYTDCLVCICVKYIRSDVISFPTRLRSSQDFTSVSLSHSFPNLQSILLLLHCTISPLSSLPCPSPLSSLPLLPLLPLLLPTFISLPTSCLSHHKGLPLDFLSPAFYSNRQSAIDERLKWIASATTEVCGPGPLKATSTLEHVML